MEKIKWSGRTTAHEHKFDDWQERPVKNPSPAVGRVVVLDVQWSTCPVEVEQQVKDLWRFYELGNDSYVLKTSIKELQNMVGEGSTVERWFDGDFSSPDKTKHGGWREIPLETNAIVQYLEEQGITEEQRVWIHWWW